MPAVIGSNVPIVIPSVHPDENLPMLVRALFDRGVSRIVVVDDGSGPAYHEVFGACREMGAEVLVHEENLGKGAALRDAFIHLIMGWEPIDGCVTADSDGQHAPDDVVAVAERFIAGGCDSLVLGVRDMGVEGVPRKSRVGNRFINACLRVLSGIKVTDSQTGLRAVPLRLMRECLDLEGDHFEFELQMLLLCPECAPLEEVPITTIYESEVNHQTHFRPVVDSLRIFYVSIRTFLRFSAASLVSTSLDIFLFWLLSMEFRSLGIPTWAILATVLARLASASLNFAINRRQVFQPGGDMRSQVVRYLTVALVLMMSSAILVQIFAPLVHHAAAVLVKIVVDCALFLINYQVQMRLVFAKRD